MFDPATLNRAADVLRLVAPDRPADAALRDEFARHRLRSGAARAAIARAVFSYYRWQGWLDSHDSLQRQLDRALELQHRFEKTPSLIKAEALAARAVPAWLSGEASLPAATLELWQREPTLWVRARPGRAESLARELGDCTPARPDPAAALPPASDALRYEGVRDLFTTDAFRRGDFEIQDLASQYVGLACAPQPGETWWDTCAGEGGKTLHLADQMDNKGVVWASDRSARRLDQLKRRFARARLFNVRVGAWDGSDRLPTRARFDGILVDAPCTGVGTWQRNPHARWTTQPSDVAELAEIQLRLLQAAAPSLKPGGRLVYSVCTLTHRETTGVADAFGAGFPDFSPAPVFPRRPDSSSRLVLWPHQLEANGMFLAAWTRSR